jgi:hypothetical protein
MAIACWSYESETQERLPGFQAFGVVGFESLQAFLGRVRVGEQIASDARDIEHIVHHGLPKKVDAKPLIGIGGKFASEVLEALKCRTLIRVSGSPALGVLWGKLFG